MIHDYIDYIIKCTSYQKYTNLELAPSHEIDTMVSPWPFSIWVVDLI